MGQPVKMMALLLVVSACVEARQTLRGRTISDRFCAMDDAEECHWDDYFDFLGFAILPFAILAVLCLLFVPVFVVLRYACGMCGGREPSRGCFCANEDDEFPGYSRSCIIFLKIFLAASIGVLLVVMFVSYTDNGIISEAVDETIEVLNSTGTEVLARADAIVEVLRAVNLSDSVLGPVGEARAVFDTVAQYSEDVDEYDALRYLMLNIAAWLPLALMGAGMILALANVRGFHVHVVLALLLALGGVLVWVSVSVYWFGSIAVYDVCHEVDLYLDGSAPAGDKYLDAVLGCTNDGHAFEEFKTALNEGVDSAATAGCTAVDRLLPSDPARDCNNNTLSDLLDQETTDPGSERNLTIRECAASCEDATARELAQGAVAASGHVEDLKHTLNEVVGPLLSCAFVASAVDRLQTIVCEDLESSTRAIAIAGIVHGSLVVSAVAILILGHKRFIPLDEAHTATYGLLADDGVLLKNRYGTSRQRPAF